jgi:hypothetical protein
VSLAKKPLDGIDYMKAQLVGWGKMVKDADIKPN